MTIYQKKSRLFLVTINETSHTTSKGFIKLGTEGEVVGLRITDHKPEYIVKFKGIANPRYCNHNQIILA